MPELGCVLQFNVADPEAIRFAERRVAELVREVSANTKAALREIIARALESGNPPRVAAREIRELVGLTRRDVRAVGNLRARLAERGLAPSVIDRRAASYTKRLHRRRAVTIARTETMRAANEGQRQLWRQAVDQRQLKPTQKRVWIATPDDRVRDEHWAMNGQVRGLEEKFERPDGRKIEPGEEVQCRCGQGLATAKDLEVAA